MANIAVVIPTFNRPHSLQKLLSSIELGSYLPTQVIVVSSGEQVVQVIEEFSPKLDLSHVHLEARGQIRQKMHGISLIRPNIDWVLFLDDDLLLTVSTLELIKSHIESPPTEGVIGFGLNLCDFKPRTKNEFFSIVKSFLRIRPGAVLLDGTPLSYMSESEITETEWLNGCSVWTLSAAKQYGSEFLDAKYSVFEDVIFSNSQSHHGKLIFLPEVKVFYQEENLTESDSYIRETSRIIWKYYFVTRVLHGSVAFFLCSEIFQTLGFFLLSSGRLNTRISNAKLKLALIFQVLCSTVSKQDPLELVKKILGSEPGKVAL